MSCELAGAKTEQEVEVGLIDKARVVIGEGRRVRRRLVGGRVALSAAPNPQSSVFSSSRSTWKETATIWRPLVGGGE